RAARRQPRRLATVDARARAAAGHARSRRAARRRRCDAAMLAVLFTRRMSVDRAEISVARRQTEASIYFCCVPAVLTALLTSTAYCMVGMNMSLPGSDGVFTVLFRTE